MVIRLHAPEGPLKARIPLPASKSESNRALILAALGGKGSHLQNLSPARDTQTMQALLASTETTRDVKDAGTTMRFLTAFLSIQPGEYVLTGTERMQKRPIGILVDALRETGADIRYANEDGYPPLLINGKVSLLGGDLSVRGDVSSQYISALMMIGPYLQGGLHLHLTGKVGSRPYIQMTASLMAAFGVTAEWNGNNIYIPEGRYQPASYTIESDWSAASYWYSMALLRPGSDLFLEGLRPSSFQGDSDIANTMRLLGVETTFEAGGARIQSVGLPEKIPPLSFDMTDTPDLAQTWAVAAASLGIPLSMSGLESLRIKETDRILALQQELAPFGVSLKETKPGLFSLSGSFQPASHTIETYEDHRMAMSFAPLATRQESLEIKEPGVVAKSYPSFWEDLVKAGFSISSFT